MIADHIGIHHAFFLLALCYIYIAYFAFRGSRHDHASKYGSGPETNAA